VNIFERRARAALRQTYRSDRSCTTNDGRCVMI
jgi:hypothetical protein